MKVRRPSALVRALLGLAAGAGFYTLGTLAFSPDIVPWLATVLGRLAALLALPSTWIDLGLTLGRTLSGFVVAFVVGVPLGLLLGRSSWADGLLFVPVVLLQACPPLFWVIPLILTLGTDGQAPAAVVVLVVLPLVTLSVREARRAVPATLWDLFRVYAPDPWLRARELLLPALGPALHSSLVLGALLGLKSAVLGEWFGAHTGLGRAIFRLYGVFDMPGFFALVFLFLGLGALIGLGSEAAARALFPARRPSPAVRPAAGSPAAPPPPPPPPGRLQLSGLRYRWTARPLIEGADLLVARGERVMLVGRSGCGKTTLARLAAGLLPPDGGRIEGPLRPAVLFQDAALLPHRDVLGNVLLPAWQRRDPAGPARALALLARVGLAGCEAQFPDELSGGMKQRTALARAFLLDPDFVILDEPFQSLDEAARRDLWDLTFRLLDERGLGALVITHYPGELAGRGMRTWTLPPTDG